MEAANERQKAQYSDLAAAGRTAGEAGRPSTQWMLDGEAGCVGLSSTQEWTQE